MLKESPGVGAGWWEWELLLQGKLRAWPCAGVPLNVFWVTTQHSRRDHCQHWISCIKGTPDGSSRRLSQWRGERRQDSRRGCLKLVAAIGRTSICPVPHSFPPCAVATALFLGYVGFAANVYRIICFWCTSVPSHYKHLEQCSWTTQTGVLSRYCWSSFPEEVICTLHTHILILEIPEWLKNVRWIGCSADAFKYLSVPLAYGLDSV